MMLVTANHSVSRRFHAQREAFLLDPNPSLQVRLDRLNRLLVLCEKYENAITDAIGADFRCRAPQETRLAELFVVKSGIRHARSNLAHWMRNRRVKTGLHFLPASNRLAPQPLGVVGVVSPWNYPFQLAMGPTLAALAAGNRVLVKPSELTPNLGAVLEHAVGSLFDSEELAVINGDLETGKTFAALPFDHLFFTGSTAVGREVAQAAAANLTPTTLELGGKSPAILDPSCDLPTAARRLAYGKLLNAGQTCIAPDYLLVPEGSADAAATCIAHAMTSMYPSIADNPDYTAIISGRHRMRLSRLVREARSSGARVIEINPAGEHFDDTSPKFPPTLVIQPGDHTDLMREEIFGPILPIVEYRDLGEAIARINGMDRPLALYWFGNDSKNRDRVLRETIAGGVTINDCLWHLAQEEQPFGGVGSSGQGAYHGEWGFRTFSKYKPVFHQAKWSGTSLFHPPYGRTFNALLRVLNRIT